MTRTISKSRPASSLTEFPLQRLVPRQWLDEMFNDFWGERENGGFAEMMTAAMDVAEIDYAADPFDPFFNANRPEDLATAARWLAAGSAGRAT